MGLDPYFPGHSTLLFKTFLGSKPDSPSSSQRDVHSHVLQLFPAADREYLKQCTVLHGHIVFKFDFSK